MHAKNRGTAIVLALFLGGLGIHKFYLGRVLLGFVYLIFCWTFIPVIISLFEALWYALMGEKGFNRRFNKHLDKGQTI